MDSRWGPLRAPRFRWQFTAQAASAFGDHLAPIALAFAVLESGGGATAIGLVLLARTAPLVACVLFGGYVGDRVRRDLVMLTADWTRAGTQAVLAVGVAVGAAPLWLFLLTQAANGIASAFFQPAAAGITPLTVPREDVQRANALLSLAVSIAVVVGPAIGGVLVATSGPALGLMIDAASFAASALCLQQVRLSRREPGSDVLPVMTALREGWQEVRSRHWLAVGIGDLAVFQVLVFSIYFVLGPVRAENDLDGAGSWGFIVAMWGLGTVLGGLVALRTVPRVPRLVVAMVALGCVGPALVTLGLSTWMPGLALSACLAGVGMVVGSVLWDTTLQTAIPEERLSRVSAFDWAGSMALRPVGYATVGPLAGLIGIGSTLLGAGVLLISIQVAVACMFLVLASDV